MIVITETPKFKLGQTVITQGAADIPEHEISGFLNRYVRGDWGNLCYEDKAMNDQAIIVGDRIVAKYRTEDKTDIYIITEWDRSVTTILLPEEY